MSTLGVASVLIVTMVNWVTRLAYILFVTFTTFNEVYYITSFACRVLSQCYRFSCSVAFSCSCKFPVYFATFTSNKRLPSPLATDTTSSTDQSSQHTGNPHIPSPSDTTCTICGRSFQTNRNLKIHFTHKHKQQEQLQLTHPGFWPCRVDIRCKCCKIYGKFAGTAKSNTTWLKLRQSRLDQRSVEVRMGIFYMKTNTGGDESSDHNNRSFILCQRR